jgi:hypothetical protein
MPSDPNVWAAPDRPLLVGDGEYRRPPDWRMGRWWVVVYLAAMFAGALILCFCLILSVSNVADQGSPGGMLLLLAGGTVIGAFGGFLFNGPAKG